MNELSLFASLGALLVVSGLFSGTETALFSISPIRLREMQGSRKSTERLVARMMAHPRRILVTILTGNLAVNILASAVGADAAIRLTGSAGWGIVAATVTMTVAVLVIGEIVPKTIAYNHAEGIARLMIRPFFVLQILLRPVQWPLLKLTELFLGREQSLDDRTDFDEVEAMLKLAHSEGELATFERDLVRGVIELSSSPLEDVMTPRTEIFALPADTELDEARRLVREAGFSKIPIAGDDPDEMVGAVTALDLLLAPPEATLRSLSRQVPYVPEVKQASELLEEFQRSGRRLALVVDEHGHLSGLVTLTDLLEEISGEMVERGDLHKVLYHRVDEQKVVVPARMEIRFFNEEFGTELESEEAETIGGLLLEQTGRIPEAGDTFTHGRVDFRVVKAEPNRVVTVEVTLSGKVESEEDS